MRDKTRFATDALQAVAANLKRAGRPETLFETISGGDKDFALLAQRLKAANITHVALALFPSEAVLLVAQLRAALPDCAID